MTMVKKGFLLRETDGVKYLTVPAFDELGGVCCAFSTRIGGVSAKPYDTLNFSRKREKNHANFLENIKRFGNAVGFDSAKTACINYAHSAQVYSVCADDAGRGIMREAISEICDGLYTDTVGLPIVSFHADCVPLFFYEPVRRCVAVCHAGWRGVVEHMAANAIKALVGMGCKAGDIHAAVGPCISVKHFEIGEDVRDIFRRTFGGETVIEQGSSFFADLNKACVLDMLHAGIAPAHITDAALCTYENAQLFFSHRRDRGRTGAMSAVIALQ